MTSLVNNLPKPHELFGCNTSVKVHFLYSYLGCFPENLKKFNEEIGERFYQVLKQ